VLSKPLLMRLRVDARSVFLMRFTADLMCSFCPATLAYHCSRWICLSIACLWEKYEDAKWAGFTEMAHERLCLLLADPVPEVIVITRLYWSLVVCPHTRAYGWLVDHGRFELRRSTPSERIWVVPEIRRSGS